MKKRTLTRIQLTLLVVLAVLVLARMIFGPPDPEGLVVMVDLEPHELKHSAFELQQPTRVAVSATGSFDTEATPSALAAYGWIIRRADREVIWQMDPARVEQGRGTAARVLGDTLALEAGIYDVYFSTYGATFRGWRNSVRARWRNDADQWQLVLRTPDENAAARELPYVREDEMAEGWPGLVKSLAPLSDEREDTYLFEVKRPTQLQLYAVGEIDNERGDYSWIEDATSGEKVWEMTQENTEPAGGLSRNRVFRGNVELAEGTYRAVAVTNDQHAWRDWEGHPPLDPFGWGLTLATSEEGSIAAFDPWSSRQPLISYTRVEDDEDLSQRFEVTQPIEVIVYCVGEITSDGVYDYGELLKEEVDHKETVWKMSRDRSVPAGGSGKNRLEVAFLRLEPGVYVLRYETDGSHAFDDWNASKPDYPERWGVSLFPMAPSLSPDTFRSLNASADAWAPQAPPPPPIPVKHAGEPLVLWQRVQNDASREQSFSLDRETRLHIVAAGELTLSGQHDYGWIARADNGERVWEMTLENTHPAGGTERNRRFDAIITLPKGQYVAHYKSDFSHHFGDFGDEAPDDEEAWGLAVYRVAEEGV